MIQKTKLTLDQHFHTETLSSPVYFYDHRTFHTLKQSIHPLHVSLCGVGESIRLMRLALISIHSLMKESLVARQIMRITPLIHLPFSLSHVGYCTCGIWLRHFHTKCTSNLFSVQCSVMITGESDQRAVLVTATVLNF